MRLRRRQPLRWIVYTSLKLKRGKIEGTGGFVYRWSDMSGVETWTSPTEELSFSQTDSFLAVEIWEDQKQTGTLQLKRRGEKKKKKGS